MPAQIDLLDKAMTLSNAFAYQHGGGDDVFVAAFQGPYELSEVQTLKEGDVVDSENSLSAYTHGEAVLLQFSPEEELPEKPKKIEGNVDKPKKAATKSESKSSSGTSTKTAKK